MERLAEPSRVLVAMSGGVDSSLAAALLVEAGCDVVGVAMRLWTGESDSGCCSLDDFLDARLVAERLGFPFYVMDFSEVFARSVVDDFVAEYRRGRTPNPCARCNQFVKFSALWNRARELGATHLATGHYARIEMAEDGPALLRGADAEKDQSYFLFGLDKQLLAQTLFPVGGLAKPAVRAAAAQRGLAVADKPDSQEVCFAPRRNYAALVEQRSAPIPPRAGPIVDEHGEVVGEHGGVHRFTVGQRRGLGLSGGGAPRYVTAIDAARGTVHVGPAERVVTAGLVADGVNWLVPPPPAGARVSLQIRSRAAAQPARIAHAASSEFAVVSDEPLRAATPGQAAVLYDGARVLGGGWIRRTFRGDELEAPARAARVPWTA
ncbi:MAG: tRNA 2-thiouridine(34) synthase MnmA [Candidatus Binatia bacterium]